MIKYLKYIFVLSILLTSCKSKKVVTNTTVMSMSTKKIIKNHYNNSFEKRTIKARLKAKYQDKKTSQNITIKLRMEKDKAIWMSGTILGIPLAKVLITPNRVTYYEKLKKTYFDGDFKLLSNFLGTEVDFEKLQNLLIGQTIFNLKDKRYISEVEGVSYLIEPKQQEELFDILFWLNPSTFKVNKQEVRQPIEQKKLTVSYTEYQKISDEVFPKKINLIAIDKTKRTLLDLEYRSVVFDEKVTFPFRIPSGYKEIKLK
ncbi:MAG: deoxyuridine 5'-triphosphate nucleotidohydrolase [Lutibacter sp.]|nr:MAG: deoxyuridine 5'-triphosphate nucleotidohydrolase [Lutibacter sp.]